MQKEIWFRFRSFFAIFYLAPPATMMEVRLFFIHFSLSLSLSFSLSLSLFLPFVLSFLLSVYGRDSRRESRFRFVFFSAAVVVVVVVVAIDDAIQ